MKCCTQCTVWIIVYFGLICCFSPAKFYSPQLGVSCSSSNHHDLSGIYTCLWSPLPEMFLFPFAGKCIYPGLCSVQHVICIQEMFMKWRNNDSFIPIELTTPFSVLSQNFLYLSVVSLMPHCIFMYFSTTNFFLSPPYRIYYSIDTITAEDACGDVVQNFLPSSFKENV